MPEERRVPCGIRVAVPGRRRPLRIDHVVLDFNGTLAVDGKLARGVRGRIKQLATLVEVVVMTADTFGTARRALEGLPVTVRVVRGGAAKRGFVGSLGRGGVAAVGNGANDAPMFRAAALGIAVCGAEGIAAELIRVATILVLDVNDALDLLLKQQRLVATLRR
jgi:P-type E1-E2 ATPase